MNHIWFAEANGKAEGHKLSDVPGQCADTHYYADGINVVTCWQPTAEELVLLNLGNPIYLVVKGKVMPNVKLVAENPFVPMQVEPENAAECCGKCLHFTQDEGGFCARWKGLTTAGHRCNEFTAR
jgi:hypothetical protein